MSVSPASRPTLDVGASTHVGRRRQVNEDAHLASFPVFVVADGMGGHDAGDRASQAIIAEFDALTREPPTDPIEVVDTVLNADDAVRGLPGVGARGAGSTLTGAVMVHHNDEWRWMVLNVGDSRVYRYQHLALERLTVDHSAVQELIDQGRITPSESETYEGRNVITRAIGAEDSGADYWLMPVVDGEMLIACSDGLTRELSEESIRAVVHWAADAQAAAEELVLRAVHAGGRDNITVVIVKVLSGGIHDVAEEDTATRPPTPPDGDWDDTLTSTSLGGYRVN